MPNVPSNDNTLNATVDLAPCDMERRGGPGGGCFLCLPDVILPPTLPPVFGGPPTNIIIKPEPRIPKPITYCKCFPEQGMHEWKEVVIEGKHCHEHTWSTTQKCLDADQAGNHKGSNDPLGGYSFLNDVIINFHKTESLPFVLESWSQSDPSRWGHSCKGVTNACDASCDDIWIKGVWCVKEEEPVPPEEEPVGEEPVAPEEEPVGEEPVLPEDEPIKVEPVPPEEEPIEVDPVRPDGPKTYGKVKPAPLIPPPPTLGEVDERPTFKNLNDPIATPIEDPPLFKKGIDIPPNTFKDLNDPNPKIVDPEPNNFYIRGTIDNVLFKDLNNPYDLEKWTGNAPYPNKNHPIIIPPKIVGTSPYDNKYVFHPISNPSIRDRAIVTTNKFTQADPNNILKIGSINKVLNTFLTTLGVVNKNQYNDKTISIFVNDAMSLVEDNLSDKTNRALKWVGETNLISHTLQPILIQAFVQAILKGKLELYSVPQLNEIYNIARRNLNNDDPVPLPNLESNVYNSLIYLSKNMRSLYPRSYDSLDIMSRIAMHTYYLPTQIGEVVVLTTQAGEEVPVEVGINSSFPVYQADGTKVEVPTFLGFFDIEGEGSAKNIVLKSNKNKLYSVDSVKRSRILSLLNQGTPGMSHVDKLETTHKVGAAYTDALAYERNTSERTLKEVYFAQIDQDTLVKNSSPSLMVQNYEADYDIVWSTGDSEAALNDIITKVAGNYLTVYVPSDDPWWSYLDTDTGLGTVTVSYQSLDPLTYMPDVADAIIDAGINYGIFYIPTYNKLKFDPFMGGSQLNNFNTAATAANPVIRTITSTTNPYADSSESMITLTPKSDKVNLEGKRDLSAIKFVKNFTDGNISKEVILDDVAVNTVESIQGKYLNRIFDLKSKYDLTYGGSKKLTQFDVYKGFTVNELAQIIGHLQGFDTSLDTKSITDVEVILNKKNDLITPTSFITTPLSEDATNTTNYIGPNLFSIPYFPPGEYFYNEV